jgi:hypothetical protein
MLFDLRGRGRQRFIKVVYITLAFLMGGGLVLFGIGGDVSGGLVDAITERGGGADTGLERFEKRETAALTKLKANPKDEAALKDLIRARVQLAGLDDRLDPNTGEYTAEGKSKLKQAQESWNQYLALEPAKPDDSIASLMFRALVGVEDLEGAARAQEIIAEARPSVGTYSRLAEVSYQAGLTRKGDLAAEEALKLADKDDRESLKGQFESMKTQSVQQSVQEALASPAASPK